ncbi:MAG: MerR family transcriptional regulator [Sphingobacteriales bacterium]|nr:MAG: MerR family transcriptional regulator [Sphingobacteriales bacterium]
MTTENLIAASKFCNYHRIEYTFISSLHEAGLIEITVIEQETFIPEHQLQRLEKMINLHQELEINIAGIEAITHLLERIEGMQQEMLKLKNKLNIYEN